ncbi:hypothetical protein [Ruficoccus sp. ZRK36]|uniref:hypothetical protein n=1 Tax=Ruficoccus sp. ZRK36 TaxID=2866311 RepID=UPI001C733AAE|nr:hypothetical protein [Ruficoccus sp. ZRK36]QYY34766.1 hypothetical protein K0V07_10680 [Ruficoccus sp. ZRK36]
MTNWIPLTESDLRTILNAAQIETLHTRPHRGGSADPLAAILEQTVARIRTEIRSCETNVLSEDETLIPPELKRTACQLALAEIPGLIRGFVLTESQEEAVDEALDILDRIRDGDLPVRVPTAPTPSPEVRTQFGLEVTRKRINRISGDQLNGL